MPPERRATKRKADAASSKRERATKPAGAARKKGDPASDAGGDERPVARGIWSGSITFGLVTVPVELYSVTRAAQPGLRMLSADGTPLARVYVSAAGEPLEDEQIERGYEVEKDRFVLVSDDELEKLAPRRSRDIELTRFVPTDAIDPTRFVRPYLALPSGEQTKAYRLLAETMQASGRAAIATFVMRGQAQAAAIVAEGSLLRVYTLRFGDELRDPVEMGIHAASKADAKALQEMTRALGALEKKALDPNELFPEGAPHLLALAREKLAKGQDVVRAPEADDASAEAEADASGDAEAEPAGAEVVDLFDLIQDRLKAGGARKGPKRAVSRPEAGGARSKASARKR